MTTPSVHISTRAPRIRLWLLIRVLNIIAWLRMPGLAERFGNWCLGHIYVKVRVGDGPGTKHRISDFGNIERTEEEE